jgi:hypothetical protein
MRGRFFFALSTKQSTASNTLDASRLSSKEATVKYHYQFKDERL